jgi:hypothetical protein
VLQEIRGESEEVKSKNDELDEEIKVYEDKFND